MALVARRAVIAGLAASALHGSKWVDTGAPIELNLANNKTPPGVIARSETLADGEIVFRRAMPVTSVARTAFDLARRGTTRQAVARLDALARHRF